MPSKTSRFEKLLEAVPDALVGMDQKGVIRFVNRQTESLFGYDRDAMVGQPVEIIVPEPLWQIYAQNRDQYFADPITRSSGLEVELSGKRRDGSGFPINITISHIDTGDVLLVITAVADVTRREVAVKNAQLIAAVVEYSNDAVMSGTLEGIVTSWNPAAERMYGYSSREMIGRSASILTPKDRAGEFVANTARVREDHHIEKFETVRVRKDGSLLPVSITVAPIHDENGVVVGASVVHRDVTEQRRAFEASQKMAAIVTGSEDAIFGSTLEGTITSWNRSAEEMFGYTSEEIIGRSGRLLSPRDRAAEIKTILTRVRAGQHIEHLETVRIRKGGAAFPVSLTVSPICDSDGTVVGASAISRDMTELHHAERYARSLIEADLDPLATISAEGKINDVNEATIKATGVPRDTLIGSSFSDYFTDPEKADEGYRQAFAEGSVTDYPLTLRHRDGTLTDVLYNASVYRDFNGDVLGVLATARDVTAQKQSFENAQRIAAIVEGSDDAIIGETLEGVITSWNPAATRMFGYSGEEIIGRSVGLLVPEAQAAAARGVVARVSAGQHVENLETLNVHKDGTVFPISLTVSPVRGADGEVVGASVICRDLTEEKRALEIAQRFAAIIESSGDAIMSGTLDGVVTSWNPAAARMFGYSVKEIIGKPLSVLSPKDQAAQQRATLSKVMATGDAQQIETTRVRSDGSVFPAAIVVSPVRDQDGTIVGFSGTVRDMTEQKRLMETAQRMEVIVTHSWDAIVGRDLNGVITSWNPAAERMFGYSSEEVIGTSARFLTPEDRAQEAGDVMARLAAGQPVEVLDTLRVRKDGTSIPVSLTVSPIRAENGEIIGASTICRDLSEMKQAASYARNLIETNLDPMLTISDEGRIDDVNEAMVRLTGVPREDLLGSDFTAYATEPDKAMAGYQQAFEQGSVTDYPLTVPNRDGTLTDLLFNASVYRDISGKVLGVLAAGRDVTEQKRAFEAAQNLAAIIDSSDDAIVSGTLDGLITSWNPAAERMYGYTSEEIIGQPAKILVPKDRRSEIREILRQVRAGRHVKHRESERVRKDGSVFPVLLSISPIRSADGAIIGTSVIHRDLTEQKGALTAAERIAAIVENSSDAIMSRTLDGTITSWNPAAERMFGYSSDEIIGKSVNLLIPQERSGELLSTLASISAGKPVTDFETNRLRKDGKQLTVSLTTSPIRDNKGAVVGASVIYRDVTELKHAARYARSLLEAVLDPLVTVSPEGRIDDVNEAMVRVTGVPRNKLIGTDFSRYLTDPDKAREGAQEAFAQGSVTDFPLTLVHRDGTQTDVICNASVYRDSSGKVLGIIAAARETSERE